MSDKQNIFEQLNDFYNCRANFFQSNFQRLVPLGDMVVDRWEKAKLLGFGEGSSIYDSSLILGDVIAGKHVWVGPATVLDGSGGGLTIGDYTCLSVGVQVYTHNSMKFFITSGRASFERGRVQIGSNVYIGPNSIVSKGVTIGDRVIIGTQSMVNSDLPDLSVAWGQPAKVVGKIILNSDCSDFTIEYI